MKLHNPPVQILKGCLELNTAGEMPAAYNADGTSALLSRLTIEVLPFILENDFQFSHERRSTSFKGPFGQEAFETDRTEGNDLRSIFASEAPCDS